MWQNEKYETVPLDVKGLDEDHSKGHRDSEYPQHESSVSQSRRGAIPLHSYSPFLFRDKVALPVYL